jgi:DNA-binding response OmpR family regulator
MLPRNQAILIIEDDLPTLALYGRELARAYRVLSCDAVSDAPALLTAEDIAAIILEPAVWDGQGWHLLQLLRERGAHLPVIICSTLDERRRGMQMGATLYLVKPVSPEVLLQTVRRLLAQV